MVKELLGRKKENTEEAYIFTEEGEKQDIVRCKEEFMASWTKQVYQKLEKADFSFWYDKEGGQRTIMLDELAKENTDIM